MGQLTDIIALKSGSHITVMVPAVLRGVTCICRDTGMCHYFGYFLGGLLPDFWVPFWAILGFLGIIFVCSRIFGYHFLVKFDFFKNNPDFGY